MFPVCLLTTYTAVFHVFFRLGERPSIFDSCMLNCNICLATGHICISSLVFLLNVWKKYEHRKIQKTCSMLSDGCLPSCMWFHWLCCIDSIGRKRAEKWRKWYSGLKLYGPCCSENKWWKMLWVVHEKEPLGIDTHTRTRTPHGYIPFLWIDYNLVEKTVNLAVSSTCDWLPVYISC